MLWNGVMLALAAIGLTLAWFMAFRAWHERPETVVPSLPFLILLTAVIAGFAFFLPLRDLGKSKSGSAGAWVASRVAVIAVMALSAALMGLAPLASAALALRGALTVEFVVLSALYVAVFLLPLLLLYPYLFVRFFQVTHEGLVIRRLARVTTVSFLDLREVVIRADSVVLRLGGREVGATKTELGSCLDALLVAARTNQIPVVHDAGGRLAL